MTILTVKELLSGYNIKYIMSKCLATDTIVSDSSIQSDFRDAHAQHSVTSAIVDTLASIGLMRLVENETSSLGVASKLEAIVSGQFAQRKGGTAEVNQVLAIPDSIADLDRATVCETLGDSRHQFQLTIEQVLQLGLLDSISKAKKEILETKLETIKASAAHLKLLHDYFGIVEATVISDTELESSYFITFPATAFSSIKSKVVASDGWSLVTSTFKPSDDLASFSIQLDHTKT